MGKQKQQTISRFFTPKPKSPPQQQQTPPPKISATVTFSPAKRHLITSKHTSNKTPKLSFNQKNLLEPSQNPPNPSYTPLEKQVLDLKSQYPDVLLMVEVGYRYRFFGSDAEDAARVLGIYAHLDRNFLTASVPTFRLNVHVRRLVSAGYKVGVVKQTETAAIKAHGENRVGPFGRGLSALYTKATLEAAEGVGDGEEGCGSCSNYLICVVEKNIGQENEKCAVRIGVVAVEISTGDVVYGEFSDNVTRAGLESVVLSLGPTELLLGEPLSKQTEKLLLAYAGSASNARVERMSRDCFTEGGALAEIMSLYEGMDESSDDPKDEEIKMKTDENNQLAIKGILAMPDFSVQALALLIRHLKQFGLERILCLGASFRPLSGNLEMNLSANALQQLEVLKNKFDSSEDGSLLQCMNHTLTIFGSRLLKHWVTHPLCDRNMILARLDAVSEIADSMISSKASPVIDVESYDTSFVRPNISCLLSSVLTILGRSIDIQRGISRIFHRTATSSEFVTVIQSLLAAAKQLQQIPVEEEGKSENSQQKSVYSILLRKLILTASSSSIICNATKLLSSVNKDAAHKGDFLNLFNSSSGLFPEVGEAQMEVEMAKDKLDSLIVSYRKELRMSKLEFMSVSGTTHLIELPSEAKVPTNWVKINSTKKTIRYHPPEVLTALDQLSLANEELAVICRTSWNTFLANFGKYYAEFQSAVQALAALDCLHSLAVLSRNKNYVRPVFVNDSEPVQIHISAGRHPVMETIIQDDFVPNDTNLHADGESCQIVTGPNMGGKSCYIRQAALIAIMAQIGSFVPASSAKLHVLDNIYTRMGSSDNIQQGRSTFLEELSEASTIIHNCTSQSLVIIDELGRGTSTHDGVAIAYATLHHILEQKKSMVLFVTHYPKIVEIKNEFPGSIGAYHVSYLTSHNEMGTDSSDGDVEIVNHQDVTYLYKLVPGVSERSFGFKVAQLAQLPDSCIRRAIVMAAKLEADVSKRVKSRLLHSLSNEKLVVNDNVQPCIFNNFDIAHAGGIEVLEEYTDLCEELFNHVDAALEENDDLARCFQCLKRAKSIANKLNSTRFGT